MLLKILHSDIPIKKNEKLRTANLAWLVSLADCIISAAECYLIVAGYFLTPSAGWFMEFSGIGVSNIIS